MKYLTVLFSLVISYTFVQAQEVGVFEYKNAIKISPFEFGNEEFQISYEHYFKNRKSSIQLMPSFILKDNQDESKTGVQVMGQYRIFLSHLRGDEGKSILGFYNLGLYGGVYALYLDYSEDYLYGYYNDMTNEFINEEFTKDLTSFEGGAILGVQVDITNRFVIDFYVGGGIRKTDIEDTKVLPEGQVDYFYYGVFDREYTGVKPKLGLQLGFTF